MAKTPKYHGKPWTPAHDGDLRQLRRDNTLTSVMDLKLGPTETSVYGHANALDRSRIVSAELTAVPSITAAAQVP